MYNCYKILFNYINMVYQYSELCRVLISQIDYYVNQTRKVLFYFIF